MIFRSAHFFFLGFFLFSLALTVLPSPVTAASLIPCGRTGADATVAERAPCTICHIITGGWRIIDWGLKVMTFVAIAVIVAMAIFYIVSTGNEGMMTIAKGGITASLVGFAVMLGAWLIINTVLNIMVVNDTDSQNPLFGLRKNGAFSFTCDTSSSAGSAQGTGAAGPVGGSLVGGKTVIAGAFVIGTTYTIQTTGTTDFILIGAANSNSGTVFTATGVGSGTGTAVSNDTAPTTGGAACTAPDPVKERLKSGGTVCNNTGSCPSCNTAPYNSLIQQYSTQYGLSVPFVKGLIARESSCNPQAEKTEALGKGKSCGLMMVNTPGSSSYTCEQLKDPETGIKEGVRILASAFASARSLSAQYGSTVTVEELAAAIHNAGAGQSAKSVDCSTSTGWSTIPKWGCPINPGTAEFNACKIKNYACNVGACR